MRFKEFIHLENLIVNIAEATIELEIDPEEITDIILNEDGSRLGKAAKEAGRFIKTLPYEFGKSPTRKAFADPTKKLWKDLKSKKPATGHPGKDLQAAIMSIRNAMNKMSDMEGMDKGGVFRRSNINVLDKIWKQLARMKGGIQGARKDWEVEGGKETLRQLGRGEEVKAKAEKYAELEKTHSKKIAELEKKKEEKTEEILQGMETLPTGRERNRALRAARKTGAKVPPTPGQAARQAKKHPEVRKIEDELKKYRKELNDARRKVGKGIVYAPSPTKRMEKIYPYPFLGRAKSGEVHDVPTDVGEKIRKAGGAEEEPMPGWGDEEEMGDVQFVPMDKPAASDVGYLSPESEKKRQQHLKDIGAVGKSGEVPSMSPEEMERELEKAEKETLRRTGRDPGYKDTLYQKMPPWKRKLVDLQRRAIRGR